MTKANHQIKGLSCAGEERETGSVEWVLGLKFSQKRRVGGGDKWRTQLHIAHLFILSLLVLTPLPLPVHPSAHGPSSSSCHYRRATVNQGLLIQWHVGRGHVTYVKRREWGDSQGVLVCEQVCVPVCMCTRLYDCRVKRGCQRVWCGGEAAVMEAVVTHEAGDQLWVRQ